jgi:hypothetical protein
MCLACIRAHCAAELPACMSECWCNDTLNVIVRCAAVDAPAPGLNQVNCVKFEPPQRTAATLSLLACISGRNPGGDGVGCSSVCPP